jgi:ribosomal protein L29
MKIRGVLASGGIPENVGKAKEIKRTIARINTFKSRKEEKTKPKTNKK